MLTRINQETAQGKLPVIAFDCGCLSHCNHLLASSSILQFLKFSLINEVQIPSIKQCVEIANKHFFHPFAHLQSKKLSVELLTILLIRGHCNLIKQTDTLFAWKLLDQLNTSKIGNSNETYRYDKRLVKKMLQLHCYDDDIVCGLNISKKLEQNNQTRLSELVDKSEDIIFTYELKQLILLYFKKIVEIPNGIKEVSLIAKQVVEYRIFDEELVEEKAENEKKEGIVKEKKKADVAYKFSKGVVMGMKSFMVKLLGKLISEEQRESELTILLNEMPNLLSFAYAFISIEGNSHKSNTFKFIRILAKVIY